MSTTTKWMTVAEFRALKDPPEGYYELRQGEVVHVTWPKQRHVAIEERLLDLLRPRARGLGRVRSRFAFRATPEHELREADVAYVSAVRWRGIHADDNLHGAPDLVIEVLSRSNTADEMEEKADLCLENGCQEFWIVRPRAATVSVYTEGGRRLYKPGSRIPVDRFFPGQPAISVEDIFADPEI